MSTIIISYRLPYKITTGKTHVTVTQASGGLATAINSLKKENFQAGKVYWMGCADFSVNTWEKNRDKFKGDYIIRPVFLDKETDRNFYNGFSNSVLWPLFHYFPSNIDYQEKYLDAYKRANETMCNEVLQILKPGDTVWIHDYHFLPLAGLIRSKQPNVKIGFFLHTPFPEYEIFRLLPHHCRNYLLKGMLGSDLVGFHTHDYNIHFLNTLLLQLGVQYKFSELKYDNRNIRSGVFPISIDFEKFNTAYHLPEVIKMRAQLKKRYADYKIIFSVDRLDYTKGVLHRLAGYEKLLEKHPHWRNKVVFILVMVPSRNEISKYGEGKQMIEERISNINGRYGNFNWSPIVYQHHSVNFNNLIALYSVCDTALISPLRDGMNLVAKEFVASRADMQGVLLLSEMTGSAKELSGAVIFNPFDADDIAYKLDESLNIDSTEASERIKSMQYRIKKHDIIKWANDYMQSLEKVSESNYGTKTFDKKEKEDFVKKYAAAQSRLLLLDYDGTLVNFAPTPDKATPTDELKDILKQLVADKKNRVVIISGRNHNTLQEWLGDIPLEIISEHGAYVKQHGKWHSALAVKSIWWDKVMAVMQDYVERCPGSFIEIKSFSMAWHYRNADEQTGFQRSRELLQSLNNYLINSDATTLDGNKVVEVRPMYTNKGNAYKQYYGEHKYDIKLAIGDDTTDEDLFYCFNTPNEIAIKVGKGSSYARYRINSVEQVIALLKQLI